MIAPGIAVVVATLGILTAGAGHAAQLALCAEEVGVQVAHGQLTDRGWVTQGWTRIDAGACQVLSVTIGTPIDLRFLALRLDGSGPVLTSRLSGTGAGQEPDYMRDEAMVCMADGNFESVGMIVLPFQDCPEGQERMVLPTRVIIPANVRYRLSM